MKIDIQTELTEKSFLIVKSDLLYTYHSSCLLFSKYYRFPFNVDFSLKYRRIVVSFIKLCLTFFMNYWYLIYKICQIIQQKNMKTRQKT